MQHQLDTPKPPNAVALDALCESTISDVAEWLSVHRSEVPEPIYPYLMQRFDLSIKEATAALQRGRALQLARAL